VVAVNLMYATPAIPAPLPDYDSFDQEPIMAAGAGLDGAALVNQASPLGELEPASSDEDFVGYVLVERDSLLNVVSLSGEKTIQKSGLLTYLVKEGDTLSAIANQFGISVNTIIWANHLQNSKAIKPGQEIVILPVSGILHQVRAGETIASIARLYGVSPDKIASFNNKSELRAGEVVIVPSGRPPVGGAASPRAKPKISQKGQTSGYFILPVRGGWNWGRIHDNNAVDISAACGAPIYAAAAGTVVDLGFPANWNNGYGGYLTIRHPNGLSTTYAHNSENLVSVGQTVDQGDLIARVGRTGKVQGPTGCHVHFAVLGGANPFAR
jgi:murein DD-endopeptidase MepM/ murein hydrolase activator NlpD